MKFILVFIVAFFLSLILTWLMRIIAWRWQIVDKPDLARKIHKKQIPLLGGTAIFLSFFIVLFFLRTDLLIGNLHINHWLGFFLASLVLILGGFLDDKFNLSASQQIIFPLLAIATIIFFGVNIEKITNPLASGFIFLDKWNFTWWHFGDYIINFSLISSLLIFFWLLGMMYTTKLLDGLDGLVTGITAIGAFIIFLFTISDKYYQADVALASLVLAAVCLGFLVFNFHPASIFLGEGGSLFLGFSLGVLAIISGGKIAIALLVIGIPAMDLLWTIIRRLYKGVNPFKVADREHLHFRILDTGLGQRQTVFLYYGVALFFGLGALFLQSKGKLLLLILLIMVMFGLIIVFDKIKIKKIN